MCDSLPVAHIQLQISSAARRVCLLVPESLQVVDFVLESRRLAVAWHAGTEQTVHWRETATTDTARFYSKLLLRDTNPLTPSGVGVRIPAIGGRSVFAHNRLLDHELLCRTYTGASKDTTIDASYQKSGQPHDTL